MKRSFLVGKREFLSNLISIRMLIITAIFALIVIGGSYGAVYTPDTGGNESQASLFMHYTRLDDDGKFNDATLYVSSKWGGEPLKDTKVALRKIEEEEELIVTKKTDTQGKVNFKNVTQYGDLHGQDDDVDYTLFLIATIWEDGEPKGGQDAEIELHRSFTEAEIEDMPMSNITFKTEETNEYNSLRLVDRPRRSYGTTVKKFLWHVSRPNGEPETGAKLFVNGTEKTSADDRGYIYYEVEETGEWNFTVVHNDGNETSFYEEFEKEETPSPYEEGPDQVLRGMSSTFMWIIVPILGIAVAYDNVIKEKESNSLFFLLSRPIKKWEIALGKLIGSFSALALPMTIVNLIGVGVITHFSSNTPTLSMVLGFILGTLALMTVFLVLQMLISTISNSTGTAILGGVGLWVFFTILFRVFILIGTTVLDINRASRAFTIWSNRASLLNPSTVYRLIIQTLFSNEYQKYFFIHGVPNWGPFVSMILWILVPTMILLYIFQNRIGK